jgi:hypothetical protein
MGDVKCASCGEPWDAYGVRNGDMEPQDAAKFNRGEGCPSCLFGTACSSCAGSGRDDSGPWAGCSVCHDKGYALARKFEGRFFVGYDPNVRYLSGPGPTVKLGVRTFPEQVGVFLSRDGRVEEWWIACPDGCIEKAADLCSSCNGSGKLTVENPDDLAFQAARDACNESDEDPMEILIERGLL